jgi:hypothetical protein
MARADRLARMDERRAELENTYRAALIAALEHTASGKPGLFGHKEHSGPKRPAPPAVIALREIGAEIAELRAALGLDPFELHHEFESARGPVSAQAPGEPKQARAWLERLA